jgi:hypothetical protein
MSEVAKNPIFIYDDYTLFIEHPEVLIAFGYSEDEIEKASNAEEGESPALLEGDPDYVNSLLGQHDHGVPFVRVDMESQVYIILPVYLKEDYEYIYEQHFSEDEIAEARKELVEVLTDWVNDVNFEALESSWGAYREHGSIAYRGGQGYVYAIWMHVPSERRRIIQEHVSEDIAKLLL